MPKYIEEQKFFKVLSDVTRLQIIDMLSCKEMCACDLLEGLTITQSTLSHHMKVLTESGLVINRKEATWMYYSINRQLIQKIHQFIDALTSYKEECDCFSAISNCENKN